MLRSISWTELGFFLALAYGAYYSTLLLIFYGRKLLLKKTLRTPPGADLPAGSAGELLSAIDQRIRSASERRLNRQELIMALHLVLQNSGPITGQTSEINRFIQASTEKYCSIAFTDAELRMVWEGLR